MASHYSRGRAAEWRLRDLLEEEGYTVIRAAGSKGPWDLIALPGADDARRKVLCIQVKTTKDPGAVQRLLKDFLPEHGVNYNTQLSIWCKGKWLHQG